MYDTCMCVCTRAMDTRAVDLRACNQQQCEEEEDGTEQLSWVWMPFQSFALSSRGLRAWWCAQSTWQTGFVLALQ